MLSNNYTTLSSQLSTISGNVANIANIANYYSGLQSSLAVVNGVVSGSGLVLAFNLKEDKFNAVLPLLKTPPSGTTSFNTLSLNYNGALALDSSNNLTINTVGFLTPSYGDLGLLGTPNGITSTSSSYVVVKQLSQPITCSSSLNVSGYTTLSNNTTMNSSLNVNGITTLNNALFINNHNTQNTYFKIGTTGNILNIANSTVYLGCSENIYDTHIALYGANTNAGASYYRSAYNTAGNAFHVFGDITGNTFFTSSNLYNYSNQPFIAAQSLLVSGNSTFNSNVNVNANIYANNLQNKSPFSITFTTQCQINNNTYYRYDLDLRYYTTYITSGLTTTRIFKFMSWLASGYHINSTGNFTLNYDIYYSQTPIGLNGLMYGFPSSNNMAMNQVCTNGLFIWQYTFNYISLFSISPGTLQCLIIDYL